MRPPTLLHNKPRPSVSKADERPPQSHFACPGCSERRHPRVEEHEQPAPLPAFRGNPCKGNIKGHGKNDQKHKNTTLSGLYFMPVVLASVRSPLYGCGGGWCMPLRAALIALSAGTSPPIPHPLLHQQRHQTHAMPTASQAYHCSASKDGDFLRRKHWLWRPLSLRPPPS